MCLASKLKKIRKLATSSCPFMGEQINFCWVSKFGRKTSLFDAFWIETFKHLILTKINHTLVNFTRCVVASTSAPQFNAYSTSKQKAVLIKKRIISKSPIIKYYPIATSTINNHFELWSSPTKIRGSQPQQC